MSSVRDYIIGTLLGIGLVLLSVVGFVAILVLIVSAILTVFSPIIIVVWLIVRSIH